LENFISKSEEGEEDCEDVHTESLNIPPVPQLVNSEQDRTWTVGKKNWNAFYSASVVIRQAACEWRSTYTKPQASLGN